MEFSSCRRYIKNASTCGTVPTEYLPGRWQKISDTQKCKKDLLVTGQDKRKKESGETCPPGRKLEKRKVSHTLGSPIAGRDTSRDRGGASEAQRRAQQQVGAARMERHWHRSRLAAPQPEACAGWYTRGLGAETQASEDRAGERTGVACLETA